ncbi:hypothetical protein BN863_6660 [Formosa agariphila KMM 3901]|uniref:YokE-like PH domain-containing protein n=2 Tax=Formosa TaxID=225842 RepID=T2KIW3_FORAG|nr:hypothetical protein BN863_6660 [Formosa agariphila KMM 3901]
MIVVNGQLFWFKNAVQWNKKGIVIKLNAFFKSTSISFNHISDVELTDNTLKISRHNKKDSTFDLKDIEPSDSKKIFDIINTNRIVENSTFY